MRICPPGVTGSSALASSRTDRRRRQVLGPAWLAAFVGKDMSASSALTQARRGGGASGRGLLADIAAMSVQAFAQPPAPIADAWSIGEPLLA